MPHLDYPASAVERQDITLGDPHHGSGRNDFERDRDRILYSSAFRALAGKSQVAAATEVGYLHNRLTHSLKVAQLGRSMATRLNQTGASVDPALVEAACLAHDIGHPPFGHAGEVALNECVEEKRVAEAQEANRLRLSDHEPLDGEGNPLDGFEGNAQNLRILTHLATHRMWSPPGLHLTRATLAATVKYPWTRATEGKRSIKWGAYEAERDVLAWVREDRPADAPERPVEAELMDWADDVTYAVHDMEDWYRQGLIPLARLFRFERPANHKLAGRDESIELAEFLDWLEDKWRKPEFRKHQDVSREELVVELHNLADRISVVDQYDRSRDSRGRLHATVSDLISYFADSTKITAEGFWYHGTLEKARNRQLLCDVLKEFVWYYVIGQPSLAAQQHGQKRVIGDLFRWTHEDPDSLLPRDLLDDLEATQDPTRVVSDFVAGLTEPLALRLHGKLSGQQLGWVTDTI